MYIVMLYRVHDLCLYIKCIIYIFNTNYLNRESEIFLPVEQIEIYDTNTRIVTVLKQNQNITVNCEKI